MGSWPTSSAAHRAVPGTPEPLGYLSAWVGRAAPWTGSDWGMLSWKGSLCGTTISSTLESEKSATYQRASG